MKLFQNHPILFLFLLLSNSCKWITANQENFTAAIKDLIAEEGVTEEQVRRWWYYTQAQRRGHPRTFPICFDSKETLPGKVEKFRTIIEKLNTYIEYDPDLVGWPATKLPSLFSAITYNRIKIQASKPNPDILGARVPPEGATPLKLSQLVDFKVSFSDRIQGLYVQAYGGPMGVPTGEFLADLKCTHGDKDPPDYHLNMNVIPCNYAPRTAFIHPNVFIFDTETRDTVYHVQFRFRWTETQCHETAFFQFIMLATKDFKTFSSILSPLYRYILEKESAVPTPYHPYHDKVTCSDGPDRTIIFKPDGSRIMPNKQYDECILKGTDRNLNNEDHTCPPGQFKCDMKWINKKGWQDEMDIWWKEFIIEPTGSPCCNLEFPLSGKPKDEPKDKPAPTVQEKQENYLKEVILRSEKRQQITHGDFCVLVWMVLIPLANLISRFFKDFSEISSLGLGFWIVGHFILHTAGLILVWWSFGLVVGGGQDRLGNVTGRHFLLGIIATAIQHAQFVTGLRRQEENERKIFNFVLIHSVGGYFSHLVAYISVLLSNADAERKYFSLGLFVIWLIATISFHLAEMRQDKILGVVLHRAQCPVLQRIVIDGGRPPMYKTKIIILSIASVACVSLYTFMKIYFSLVENIITGQDVEVVNGTNGTDASRVVLS